MNHSAIMQHTQMQQVSENEHVRAVRKRKERGGVSQLSTLNSTFHFQRQKKRDSAALFFFSLLDVFSVSSVLPLFLGGQRLPRTPSDIPFQRPSTRLHLHHTPLNDEAKEPSLGSVTHTCD
mmetsp:Transcript_40124/g.79089  ORF Transcript_40124/g.79089 Transcript_40124/m.79089 type:complete len:121 (-) Transcript_40124:810-1172(-)